MEIINKLGIFCRNNLVLKDIIVKSISKIENKINNMRLRFILKNDEFSRYITMDMIKSLDEDDPIWEHPKLSKCKKLKERLNNGLIFKTPLYDIRTKFKIKTPLYDIRTKFKIKETIENFESYNKKLIAIMTKIVESKLTPKIVKTEVNNLPISHMYLISSLLYISEFINNFRKIFRVII